MLAFPRRNFLSLRNIKVRVLFSTKTVENIDEEYSDKPKYPEIIDTSYVARKIREKVAWHDAIKKAGTIEEKLIKINIPRYYGYRVVMLNDTNFPYNCLPLIKHYTRTSFEQVEKLPDFYTKNDAVVNSYLECIKSAVKDSVEYAHSYFRENFDNEQELERRDRSRLYGRVIVEEINRTLINSLSPDCPHLAEIESDLEPRHEGFWFVGAINPPKSVKKFRECLKGRKGDINNPVDRAVQYLGKPYLALRHRLPLQPFKEIVNYDEDERQSKVGVFKYDSRVVGYHCSHRHGTNVPGFWPGSPYEFGLLSYQPRDYLIDRNADYGADDFQEALHVHGIQSSYAWLLSQACYQGFSTYNDVTYPLTTQTIVTDGKQWSFYAYQLNTTLVHSNNPYDNPKVNYCWGTKDMDLFKEIDENGRCVDFNDDVLRYLIHFYVNAPTKRDVDLKPYLGNDVQKIADIEDEDRRTFLEQVFKHMISNRPRHRELPEIYLWERLYKIDHKTRQMEPKRRFFELKINPFKRRMDEHTPPYIPKALRPEGPKSKKKWAKMYYP